METAGIDFIELVLHVLQETPNPASFETNVIASLNALLSKKMALVSRVR